MTRKSAKPTRKPKPRSASATAMSRRSFVTMVAAGSAALLARPAAAADAPRAAAKAADTTAGPSLAPATQKEFDRQRAGMLATLKTLREAPLPPGGDLSVVFKPQRVKKAVR